MVSRFFGSGILGFVSAACAATYYMETYPRSLSGFWKNNFLSPIHLDEQQRFAEIARKIGWTEEQIANMEIFVHSRLEAPSYMGPKDETIIIFPECFFRHPADDKSQGKFLSLDSQKKKRNWAILQGNPTYYFRDEVDFHYATVASLIYGEKDQKFLKRASLTTLGCYLVSIPVGAFFNFNLSRDRSLVLGHMKPRHTIEIFWGLSMLYWFFQGQNKDTYQALEHAAKTIGNVDGGISGMEAFLAHNISIRKGVKRFTISSKGNNLLLPLPLTTTKLNFLKNLKQRQEDGMKYA